jgi:hypothetical protein
MRIKVVAGERIRIKVVRGDRPKLEAEEGVPKRGCFGKRRKGRGREGGQGARRRRGGMGGL